MQRHMVFFFLLTIFSNGGRLFLELLIALTFLVCIDHETGKDGPFEIFSMFLNHAMFAHCPYIWGPLSENWEGS